MKNLDAAENRLDFGLALDTGGFVRRECPSCGRHFKVAGREEQGVVLATLAGMVPHANAGEIPPSLRCWCAYCGHRAPATAFLTPAQRVYLEDCARRLDSFVQIEQMRVVDPVEAVAIRSPPVPAAIRPPEPDDLCAVPLLCCGESLKLKPGWQEGFFCPRCGLRHGEA